MVFASGSMMQRRFRITLPLWISAKVDRVCLHLYQTMCMFLTVPNLLSTVSSTHRNSSRFRLMNSANRLSARSAAEGHFKRCAESRTRRKAMLHPDCRKQLGLDQSESDRLNESASSHNQREPPNLLFSAANLSSMLCGDSVWGRAARFADLIRSISSRSSCLVYSGKSASSIQP